MITGGFRPLQGSTGIIGRTVGKGICQLPATTFLIQGARTGRAGHLKIAASLGQRFLR